VSVEVSCIIITHYRDDLLREALASVLSQDLSESYEVVVVDDLASPTTRALVEDIAGDRFGDSVHFVVSTEEPKGASKSRNVGARAARGKVLAFLDDDDLWRRSYLSTSLQKLRETGTDFVLTWMHVLERDGEIAPLLRMPEELGASQCVARNRGMTGSNIVVTRGAFEAAGGFDERLPVSNDKDLLVRLLRLNLRYAVVSQFNAIHRRHEGPQLTRMDEKRAEGVLRYLEKHRRITSLSDRRFIMKTVHGIRRRTARNRFVRVGHLVMFVFDHSPVELFRRLTRQGPTDGSYKSV
jgi:glycosyltransferase involved in cell wall biosynthesis